MLSWQTICWDSKDSELSIKAEVITKGGFTNAKGGILDCLNFYSFAYCNW